MDFSHGPDHAPGLRAGYRKSRRRTLVVAHALTVATIGLHAAASVIASPAAAQTAAATPVGDPRTGTAAFGDWRGDEPGVRRHIRPADLPRPGATPSTAHSPRVVPLPPEFVPKVPVGFEASRFATGLKEPRTLLAAPNGDIFVAESSAGRVSVLRPSDDNASVARSSVFASGLNAPFGLAFYPPSGEPQWLYVANSTSVVRFAYSSGDDKARAKPETIVSDLPGGGHWTRGLAFTRDGKRMLVSVGSASNVAEGIRRRSPEAAARADIEAGATGVVGGEEDRRAAVLAFTPDGKGEKYYATGIRNCVTLAVNPATGDPWCTTNERDGLGDDLVPDYATRVAEGDFFGWPWLYIGDNVDPRRAGERDNLKSKVRVPDVLLQAHSAALGLTFYGGTQFPESYRGSAFVALHGSWNRSRPTGYKVVRLELRDGVPTGIYEDFMTGLIANDNVVYGRPVGLTVARDGALLVSDDGNGVVWRIRYRGKN